MPRPPNPRRKVLLVEGRDDREVIFQFCNEHGIDNRAHFDVHDAGSDDKVRKGLAARIKTDLDTIGVIVDADDDAAARWESLRGVLLPDYGDAVPASPDPAGTIIPSSGRWPRVGIWIMPDNSGGQGMLEDFLLSLIPPEDALLPHAREAVEALPDRRFPDVKRPKAEIHTWLAWQGEPGTPLGLALKRRYLLADSGPARSLRDWLVRLFELRE
ncbi:DUF3226 domain-containing protein [Haliangium sp.]|uniref:DUF3226 domain-containing protein n=1 Tax=Haliangium sp. TaxID=2663208 RepID=UPI003D0FB7DB